MFKRIALSVTAIVVIAVAGLWFAVQPPSAPPASYANAAPAVGEGPFVEFTTRQTVPMSREKLLLWWRDNELVTFLKASGSIPAVESQTMMEGEWFNVGAKRRVNLAGGHFAVERILETNPDAFRYQIWGFTTSAGLLVDQALGEILYKPISTTETEIVWTYRMQPRGFWARPLLQRFMTNEFGPFMEKGLAAMAEATKTAL
ncbi:MAG: hypothetical protein ACRCT6_07120 [Notoacmeibacter sp.]